MDANISDLRKNLDKIKSQYEDVFNEDRGRGAKPKTYKRNDDIFGYGNREPSLSDPYPTFVASDSRRLQEKVAALETELADTKRELKMFEERERHLKRKIDRLSESAKEYEKAVEEFQKTVKEYEDLLEQTLGNVDCEIKKAKNENKTSFQQTAQRNEKLVKVIEDKDNYINFLENELDTLQANKKRKEKREKEEEEDEYGDDENAPYMQPDKKAQWKKRSVRVVSSNPPYPSSYTLGARGVTKR